MIKTRQSKNTEASSFLILIFFIYHNKSFKALKPVLIIQALIKILVMQGKVKVV